MNTLIFATFAVFPLAALLFLRSLSYSFNLAISNLICSSLLALIFSWTFFSTIYIISQTNIYLNNIILNIFVFINVWMIVILKLVNKLILNILVFD